MKIATLGLFAGLCCWTYLVGCETDAHLTRIEKSTKKTEGNIEDLNKNTGEELSSLNQNTEGFNRNLEDLNSEIARLKEKLATTQDSLERMGLQMEILAKSGDATYRDLRKAQTAALRQEFWSGFTTADRMESRVAYAVKFMAGLEYHFWKPNLESETVRDELLQSDLRELFGNLDTLRMDVARAPSFAFPESAQQEELFGFSLALADGETASPESDQGLQPLFLKALHLSAQVEVGDQSLDALRPFEKTLLRNASEIRNLLLLRTNALGAFFVAQTSRISQEFPWNWLEKNRLQMGTWVADTKNKSLVELAALTATLQNALDLESALTELSISGNILVDELKQILRNCQVSEGSELVAQASARGQALASLQGVVTQLAGR